MLGFATAAAAGCSDSSGPAGEQCSAPVTFSVTSGLTPTIGWTPDCDLVGLFVETVETGADMWAISATGTRGIAPGVVYGTVPEGAEEDLPADPLEAGVSYRVIGVRSTGAQRVLAGSTTITP